MILKNAFLAVVLAAAAPVFAAPATYRVTFTNGSSMPISPIAVYAEHGSVAKTQIGAAPTMAFVQLCQTGNAPGRVQELMGLPGVVATAQTMGLLMPGESQTVEVAVSESSVDSIQFEAMYGKTKDVCAMGTIGSSALSALAHHAIAEVSGKDTVVQTGAFQTPALPMNHSYMDPSVCADQPDAISCLRSLAPANMGGTVRFFAGYLPSLELLLENKYGAGEVQSLRIPTSGAVHFRVTLKH